MRLPEILTRRLSSSYFDAKLSEWGFAAFSFLFLLCGLRKMNTLKLTEAEFYLGLMLLLIAALLFALGGALIGIKNQIQRQNSD